jgi:hypothetical protein
MRDELVYLRLHKLTGGLTQFTDTTNAYRLFTEYGNEMRYNTDWKKWVVWVGNKWEKDSGALIHDRGLKMVRNIYRELLNTANLYECLEIFYIQDICRLCHRSNQDKYVYRFFSSFTFILSISHGPIIPSIFPYSSFVSMPLV